MRLLRSEISGSYFHLLFSDRWSIKIEDENNSLKTKVKKFDHIRLIHTTIGAHERVLIRKGVQSIRGQASEAPLYFHSHQLTVFFTLIQSNSVVLII